MDARADLHVHTVHSDGALTPENVLKRAKGVGLQYIAITDHDTLDGLNEAIHIGKDLGIEVIPGVEVSTEIETREVHILAYFINLDDSVLQDYLNKFRTERIKRAKRILDKLKKFGIEVSFDDVLELSNGSLIARTHIANAMVKKQYIENYHEAFEKYIGDDGPAYEKKIHLAPKDIISLINESNGLSFIAHPNNLLEEHVKSIINAGIDGIEVIHPNLSKTKSEYYKGIVSTHFLLESGGSDFHGGSRNDDNNFGQYYISAEKVHSMKKRLNK